MLPRPATFSISTHSSYRLFGRARVTNLGVYLLLGALLLSLAANWRQWLANNNDPHYHMPYGQRLSLDSSLQPLRNISNLIVVAGHAVFQGCQPSQWNQEDQWILQDHQKGTNSPEAFYSHITKGVHLLSADPSAILIFSGGVTRQDHPIQSEAQSYLKLAIANNLLTNNGDQLQLRSRAFTEDYALDSFQNLLFSIARFHELAVASGIPANSPSAWPTKITVVGFEMKKRRFVELHRRALLFPEDRFEYVGVDFVTPEAKERGWDGENKFGYQPYSKDLYGCHGELAAKRKARNPYARFHPYHMTNPELAPLLDWCPSNFGSLISAQVYPRTLPWN